MKIISGLLVLVQSLAFASALYAGEHLIFSPDGAFIASGNLSTYGKESWGTDLRLLAIEGKNVTRLPIGAERAECIAFSPDGKTIAVVVNPTAKTNGSLILLTWDGKVIKTRPLNKELSSFIVSFSADGKLVAIDDTYGVRLYDLSLEPVALLSSKANKPGRKTYTPALAFSPDNKTVAVVAGNAATGGENDHVALFEKNGSYLRSLPPAGDALASLTFSPEGKLIVGGTRKGKVFVWTVEGGQLATLQTAGAGRSSFAQVKVAFGPDNATVLTADNATLRAWKTDGTLIRSVRLHFAVLENTNAFSRDGRSFAALTAYGTIDVWSIDDLLKAPAPGSGTDPVLSPRRIIPLNDIATHCKPDEHILFACSTGKKLISLCLSGDFTKTTGYVKYRFGPPGTVEMTYPEGNMPNRALFTFESVDADEPDGAGRIYPVGSRLSFKNGPYAYTVYDYTADNADKDGGGGVVVQKDGKRVTKQRCKDGSFGPLFGNSIMDMF